MPSGEFFKDENAGDAWVANAKYVTEGLRQAREDVKELRKDLHDLREDFAWFKGNMTAKVSGIAVIVSVIITTAINMAIGKL